ncbi:hydrolase [Flavobacteriaceae bacterium]|nr:hydrolase [Flavobacteriaceae bacterium]MDB9988415.1 hydrolase [Flavobacteriaceae bacterium]|tara:strand:+ start:788 stop:1279 length:492 start_codon:yes stop_codon:yes gene_type:complete
MKKNIFIYLFSFTALILVFQIVNSNKIMVDQQRRLEKKQSQLKALKDSLKVEKRRFFENVYFSLDTNEEALVYFEDLDFPVTSARIKDALYDTNLLGEEESLVPYAQMGGKFLINKIKVLNHKWAIADFSDGTFWGELLIKYQVAADGTLTFTVVEHFLYATN